MQVAEKKATAMIKSAERERQQAQGNSALARQAFESQIKVIGSFVVVMVIIKCTAGLRLVFKLSFLQQAGQSHMLPVVESGLDTAPRVPSQRLGIGGF